MASTAQQPRLCSAHGGNPGAHPSFTDCDRCEEQLDRQAAAETVWDELREAREARIEAAWRALGGRCRERPFAFRWSSDPDCAHVLESLHQLCSCQLCDLCDLPHNTGREAFAEDECQCAAGDGP